MLYFEILFAVWAIVVWSLIRSSYRKHITAPTRDWLALYCDGGNTRRYEDPRERILSFAKINQREYAFILLSAVALIFGLVVLLTITYLFWLSWVSIAIYVGFVMGIVEITLSTNMDSPSIQCELHNSYKKLEQVAIVQDVSTDPRIPG